MKMKSGALYTRRTGYEVCRKFFSGHPVFFIQPDNSINDFKVGNLEKVLEMDGKIRVEMNIRPDIWTARY